MHPSCATCVPPDRELLLARLTFEVSDFLIDSMLAIPHQRMSLLVGDFDPVTFTICVWAKVILARALSFSVRPLLSAAARGLALQDTVPSFPADLPSRSGSSARSSDEVRVVFAGLWFSSV